jgi:hypothetical protein
MAPKKTSTSSSTKKSTKKTEAEPKQSKTSSPRGATTKKSATPKKSATAEARKTTTNSKKSTTSKAAQGAALAAVSGKTEVDIATLLESVNTQLQTAMSMFEALGTAEKPDDRLMRTTPLDRAAATFQRLVSEVVDDQLAGMLPPLVSLRTEMRQRQDQSNGSANGDAEFYDRAGQMLDQVLAAADVQSFDARVGEQFDPVIHLAVGEETREDLNDGSVAAFLQPGYRFARGKVIVPAKIKVNRR